MPEEKLTEGKIDKIIGRSKNFSLLINGNWYSFFGKAEDFGLAEGFYTKLTFEDNKVGNRTYHNGKEILLINNDTTLNQKKVNLNQATKEANQKYNIGEVGNFVIEKQKLKDRFGEGDVYGRVFYGIYLESVRCAQMDGLKESYEKAVKDYVTINLRIFNELY